MDPSSHASSRQSVPGRRGRIMRLHYNTRTPPRRLLLFLVVDVFLLASEVGAQRTHARQGGANQRDLLTVRLPSQGTIVGKEVFLSRTQRVIQYLGIPYAQPPIGQLRFSAPVTDPLPSWTGVRNASFFGPSCPQISERRKLHERNFLKLLPQNLPNPGLSEDCLFLNIFVPDSNRPAEGWPVMVWFHGGDFNGGTPAIWDASVFVTKQKVLVVTVAYRLNILGFFTTTDAEAPGNYGMLDQIAALDWVKRYIELFDGSPKNIVIYGHSAGAISVSLHMMSPLSRAKFSKAIAMSGDAINSVRTPQEELPVVDQVAYKFGCLRKTSDLMECLRNKDLDTLIRESAFIETWGPIVDAETNNSTDGPFLPKHPRDVGDDDFYSVPLVAGYTNNEQALAFVELLGSEHDDGRLKMHQFESFIRDEINAAVVAPDENSTCELRPELVSDAVTFFYKPHPPTKDTRVLRDRYLDLQTEKNYAAGLIQLAAKVSSHPSQTKAFVYRFDYRARTASVSGDVPEWAGVPHLLEQPFVWGLPYATGTTTQWNAADKKMSDMMMSMFSTFARTGNPSLNTIKWEPHTEMNPGILIIERNIDMSDPGAVDFKALAFWNEYYPLLLEAATNNCCNVTSGAISLTGLMGEFLPRSTGFIVTAIVTALKYFADQGFV
ncbi:fatty acyl-CoA hydrolase precursor, medium chain [Nasonia vitripennis]|uniref:Carboxylesterase type B domain-containing protein n=1 Tax=Nasonia vitripennis TaxID=7425 RepID=A0A7M7T6J6_NASVI|nr:fatty acyl-CoA hydrolase precursor, medium chain [Nasonia vitripennis]